ncbi:MAG TPA: hypothetical protein VGH29_17860 [Candidatus Binataceae bacterium]
MFRAMVLTAAIFPLGARASWAHDHAPDPTMLLNLDLFASAGSQGPDATNTSMLEQIQTLRAMGYLNGTDAPGPQPAYINPPPPPPQLPADTEDDIRE